MAESGILTYPDERLRQHSSAVEAFDATLEALAAELIGQLTPTDGIGLCAPQLGVAKRVIVLRNDPAMEPEVLVNPVLSNPAVPCIVEERCLSLPGLVGRVFRSAEVTVNYQTLTGEPVSQRLTGMPAVCAQHEVDHLDGKLFLDRLSSFRRWRYRKWGAHRQQAATA